MGPSIIDGPSTGWDGWGEGWGEQWDEGWGERWGEGWDERWGEGWGKEWDGGWGEVWGEGWGEGAFHGARCPTISSPARLRSYKEANVVTKLHFPTTKIRPAMARHQVEIHWPYHTARRKNQSQAHCILFRIRFDAPVTLLVQFGHFLHMLGM